MHGYDSTDGGCCVGGTFDCMSKPELILDWSTEAVACGSLGNIVGHATATEYIREQLGMDVGVVISHWHKDIWPLYLPADRIYYKPPAGPSLRLCGPVPNAEHHGWLQMSLAHAGFALRDGDLVKPRLCWTHARSSRTVLLYPREYDNQNRLFTQGYWIEASHRLIAEGWRVAAILDHDHSHRDGGHSAAWCRGFREAVPLAHEFPPTISGLQAGVSVSEAAAGRFNGPCLLMAKSSIRQLVVDDPNDYHPNHTGVSNLRYLAKPIKRVLGNTLDWTAEL